MSGDVVLGRIAGVYGVRGWVRVYSHTRPKENILSISPWQLVRDEGIVRTEVIDGRPHGKGLVAKLAVCPDRDHAQALVGADIQVSREQLPATASDEFYWADLVGLRVVTAEGVELGTVSGLLETGASDVLVVKGEGEYLIPVIFGHYVIDVDLEQGRIKVDWDPEDRE